MNKAIGLCISSIIIIVFYIFISSKSMPTITYFPPQKNEVIQFDETKTMLNQKQDSLEWETTSKTNQNTYLRQDLSLLLHNDTVIGILNKWRKDQANISLQRNVPIKNSGKYEAITLHFGEIHNQEKIHSLHEISSAPIYVYDDNYEMHSFKDTNSKKELLIKKQYDEVMKQSILGRSEDLTTYFKMNIKDYDIYSLTETRNDNPDFLSDFDIDKRDKIIGQLWEGIYKSYAIPILQKHNTNLNNTIPIVFIDKKNTHLIVLFELNGVKEKLLQKF